MIKIHNLIKKTAEFLFCFLLLSVSPVVAQSNQMIRGKITSATDREPLISATINEVDKSNRVVGGVATNLDGDFVIKVKSTENKLVFTYIGFTKQERKIGTQTVFNIALAESNSLKEIEVVSKQMTNTGGMNIPTREISIAMQKVDAKDFENLQVSSVDDALQGRVSGLDIVGNSGAPGSGMSMRIRGTTSINGSSQPLIVVNGLPYETNISSDFDFATAREEQYADLLNVNPDDILDIVILKDAASTAIWGSKGANGVLQITTKKGVQGKPRLQYSYRYTVAEMPRTIPLLNGDGYTMMMKEAYLNPALNTANGNIPEYGYIQDGTDFFWNYNNNTDWVKALARVSRKGEHNTNISGGGERATYRVSLGYLNEEGIVKGAGLKRFTNRTNLDYKLSDRLRFVTELAYTYSDIDKNYENDVLDIAMRKMPNTPIYARDKYGNYTDVYFNINRPKSKLDAKQRDMVNPVALVNLAKYNEKSYRVTPTFNLQYDILDPKQQMLRFVSKVSMDVNNKHTYRFLPKEVSGAIYDDKGINFSFSGDEESTNILVENNITWQPKLPERHSFIMLASVQTTIGEGMNQSLESYWSPSSQIQTVEAGFPSKTTSSSSVTHGYGMFATAHYAYMEKYILDFVLRRDASSRFGKSKRFAYFPGFSGRWNISDEPFMKGLTFLNMLAIRPSWGVSGSAPGQDYLFYSKYSPYESSYIDLAAIYPNGLQITNLKWETTTQTNLGIDLALFDNRFISDINFYHKSTKDLLFSNLSVPSTSGFANQSYENTGTMNNDGWEINIRAPGVVKVGKVSLDLSFNLSNYINTLKELSPKIKKTKGNMLDNGQYLRNIIINNPLGSFYGYKFKGVYQYSEYIPGVQESAPVARDKNNKVIYDRFGVAKPMWFNYNGSNKYEFKGGDAIYEDVNHDGSIDELDVVYLGNANPKFNGGFNAMIRYKSFSINGFFHFRYGNQIVNEARMNLENMYGNDNQSIAVNWRWRKEGDVTEMPRALFNTGFNWLGSDRYVEDGSFLRFKYITLNYALPKAILKPYKLTDLKFYCTLNNIKVWTNYSGVDPEVGYAASKDDPFRIGYDNSKTPRSIDITFGATVGF
jgi:TonB-linked SusC/RagA family outer membrane protein